jgi:hypothetical protein
MKKRIGVDDFEGCIAYFFHDHPAPFWLYLLCM